MIGKLLMLWRLKRQLRSNDCETRCAAVWQLIKCRPAGAVALLIRALKDYSPNVRRAAATGLGRLGDAQAVPALIEALDDPEADSDAGIALGLIGDESAVDALERSFLRNGARGEAGRALAKIRGRGIEVLKRAFLSGTYGQSAAAAIALAEINILPTDPHQRARVLCQLGRHRECLPLGAAGITALEAAYVSGGSRDNIALLLAEMRNPGAVRIPLAYLESIAESQKHFSHCPTSTGDAKKIIDHLCAMITAGALREEVLRQLANLTPVMEVIANENGWSGQTHFDLTARLREVATQELQRRQ